MKLFSPDVCIGYSLKYETGYLRPKNVKDMPNVLNAYTHDTMYIQLTVCYLIQNIIRYSGLVDVASSGYYFR